MEKKLRYIKRKLSRTNDKFRPEDISGHLYYIKVKTELGIFYKIGFTKMNSILERFSRDGSQDYKYIDKILIFKHMEDAYDIESALHDQFSDKSSFGLTRRREEYPFAGNGQSELYYDDVLGVDPQFSRKEAFKTKFKVDIKKESFESLIMFAVFGIPLLAIYPLAFLFAKMRDHIFPEEISTHELTRKIKAQDKQRAYVARVIAYPRITTY